MERSGKTTFCRENHGRVSFWSTSTVIFHCFESADRLTKAFQIWQSESRKSFRIERQKTVKNLRRTCTEMLCDWHPPVCLNHQSESGCMYGDKCFQHTGFFGKPSKKSKKGGAQGSVASVPRESRFCAKIRRILKTRALCPQRRLGTGKGCPQTQGVVSNTFLFSCRSSGDAGGFFDKSRRATSLKLHCVCHVKRTSAQERRNSQEFQIRHDSGNSQRRGPDKRRSASVRA